MEEIEDYIKDLIREHHSIDIAEAEFKRIIADDAELRSQYQQWCEERGSSERHGFRDFCDEYQDSQNEIWQTLTDYDAE